jgi:hypothetical protein|tara:strand:+ start:2835 stop:3203 length:369 start_codon:yes stop_codon:yes gene_type:complete
VCFWFKSSFVNTDTIAGTITSPRFEGSNVLMCPPAISLFSAFSSPKHAARNVPKSSPWCFPKNRSFTALTCVTAPSLGGPGAWPSAWRRLDINRTIFGKLKHSIVAASFVSVAFRGSPFSSR